MALYLDKWYPVIVDRCETDQGCPVSGKAGRPAMTRGDNNPTSPVTALLHNPAAISVDVGSGFAVIFPIKIIKPMAKGREFFLYS